MLFFLIFIIAIILLSILIMYNTLIRLKNRVNQSKSGIDVYLNQRFDLIPNLVECVKGYTKHESQIFENIAKLRALYNETNKLEDASKLNNNLNQILLMAENYPELKASEQFLNLQNSLTKIESQLQAARRIYNNDVTKYNIKIQSVPSNLIAKLFGFEEFDLFQIEEFKKENINVEL